MYILPQQMISVTVVAMRTTHARRLNGEWDKGYKQRAPADQKDGPNQNTAGGNSRQVRPTIMATYKLVDPVRFTVSNRPLLLLRNMLDGNACTFLCQCFTDDM